MLFTQPASAGGSGGDVRWSITFGNSRSYDDGYRSHRGYDRYDRGYPYGRGYDRGYGSRYGHDGRYSRGYTRTYDRGYGCERVYVRPVVVKYRYDQPRYRSGFDRRGWDRPGLVFNNDRYRGRGDYGRYNRRCD